MASSRCEARGRWRRSSRFALGSSLRSCFAQEAHDGRAFQYQEHPLQVDVGDRVRLFVVNAGPSFTSDFHIVGTVFNKVYTDGNPSHALSSVQTWGIPAGGGAVFETVFTKDGSGEGTYAFVTHAFADAAKGAVGLISAGALELAAGMTH